MSGKCTMYKSFDFRAFTLSKHCELSPILNFWFLHKKWHTLTKKEKEKYTYYKLKPSFSNENFSKSSKSSISQSQVISSCLQAIDSYRCKLNGRDLVGVLYKCRINTYLTQTSFSVTPPPEMVKEFWYRSRSWKYERTQNMVTASDNCSYRNLFL